MRKMYEFSLLMLEKVFEAVYFSLFLICGKNIKEKRLLFVSIMIFEYLALKYFMHFSVCFHLIYTFMSFINLKVLYKEKAQITDIFLFMTASFILMIICGISYGMLGGWKSIINYLMALILSRILIVLFLLIFSNKINEYYKKIYMLWNKHSYKNKMKSLTIRNISIILFNVMFYIINLVMGLYLIIGRR